MDNTGSAEPHDRESAREDAPDSKPPEIYSPYLPADFEHWSKVSYWEPLEAACLSLGLGPLLIQNASDEQLHSEPDTFEMVRKRFQITSRAVEAGTLRKHATPHEWMDWFSGMTISTPTLLTEWVSKIPNLEKFGLVRIPNEKVETILSGIDSIKSAVSGDKSSLTNSTAATKEINSLERIVIAMAVGGYGHDPLSRRSSTAREIADDAAGSGIQLSEDTIRKYLNRAAENHMPSSD